MRPVRVIGVIGVIGQAGFNYHVVDILGITAGLTSEQASGAIFWHVHGARGRLPSEPASQRAGASEPEA